VLDLDVVLIASTSSTLRRASLAEHPPRGGELDLAGVADWGPAEDWSDWAGRGR